jgi:hypothetical protein
MRLAVQQGVLDELHFAGHQRLRMLCAERLLPLFESLNELVAATDQLRNHEGAYEDIDFDTHIGTIGSSMLAICDLWQHAATRLVNKHTQGESVPPALQDFSCKCN